MRKKALLIISIIFFLFNTTSFVFAEDSDDNSLDDLIRKIEDEKEKNDTDDADDDTDDDDDDEDNDAPDNENSCFSACFSACFSEFGSLFIQLFIEYMLHVRFADYPYADSSDYDFSMVFLDENLDEQGQIGFLKASIEPEYLLDTIMGITGKVDGYLSFITIDIYNQYLYEGPDWFNIFSLNGGISIAILNVMTSVFCGIFTFDYPGDVINEALFSYGAEMQLFFHNNISIDLYNLNSFYYSLGFHIVSASLNFHIALFSLGIGYNLNLFAYDYEDNTGLIYHGPFINLTIWL